MHRMEFVKKADDAHVFYTKSSARVVADDVKRLHGRHASVEVNKSRGFKAVEWVVVANPRHRTKREYVTLVQAVI